MNNDNNLTLVIGSTGKTGRRVFEKLKELQVPVRTGSRSSEIPFDWDDQNTWAPAIEGVKAVYITFYPDLSVPGAADSIRTITEIAEEKGVERIVLLSGRGEEEAQVSEQIVQNSKIDSTIVRAAWFSQNFSEGAFRDMVLGGNITLPAGDVREPFVDVDDIAEVVVAALTEDGHAGELYEVTGPRLMTFGEVASDISQAIRREVQYTPIPLEAFTAELKEQGMPEDGVKLLTYLFSITLDGRNEHLTDGVERALGRKPKDFKDYAKDVAGSWQEGVAGHAG